MPFIERSNLLCPLFGVCFKRSSIVVLKVGMLYRRRSILKETGS